MNNEYDELINRLRDAVAGSNKTEIARLAGVTRQTIHKFISGGKLELGTITQIAGAVGIDMPRVIKLKIKRDVSAVNLPAIFNESHPEVPEELEVSEQEAAMILATRDKSSTYFAIKPSVVMLELNLSKVHNDTPQRRAMVGALGVLKAYVTTGTSALIISNIF